MKNKSLKWKLLISYGVIFLFLVILGMSSISVINMMSKKSYEYAEEIVPSVEEIGLARRNMVSVRRYLLNSIIVQTPEDYSRVSESMETDKDALYASLDKIEEVMPIYSNDLDAIRKKLESVSDYNQQIMTLAKRFGDTQARQQAYDIYLNKYASTFDEAANMLIDLNNRIDNTANNQKAIVQKAKTISMIIIFAIIVLSFLSIILFIVLMLRYILVPVRKLVDAAYALEKGDFSNAVVEYESDDEFGELSKKITNTMKRIVFITKDIEYGLNSVLEGNLNVSSQNDNEYEGEYLLLRNTIYKLIVGVNDIIYRIKTASDQLSSGAEQVALGAQALSQGAADQTSSIEELIVAVSEISDQVNDNATLIEEVGNSVDKAVSEVTTGSRKMEEMLSAMNDINIHSKEIEKITKSIEDIAFQTNILALNAAVEAARAGGAGKGFAVVADEVRRLAKSTAEASKNTTALILKSLQSVTNGKTIADETAEFLKRICDNIMGLSEQAKKVSENSSLQNDAVNQIIANVDKISNVIHTNSATAQEGAASSEELSGQAIILKELTAKFQLLDKNVPLDNTKEDEISNSQGYDEDSEEKY